VATARFIDLLTCEDGIASEAYQTAQDIYAQNEQTSRAVFKADKLMGVKVLHFLDRVFEEFATDLSRYVGQENPLRAASASLKGCQRSTVMMTLGSLRYGAKPTISLPPGLVSGQQQGAGREMAQPSGGGAGTTDDGGGETGASGEPQLKSVTLPEGWRIPREEILSASFSTPAWRRRGRT
jgi:hypothetical protein